MTYHIVAVLAILAFLGPVAAVHAESVPDHFADMDEPHGVVIGDLSRLSQDIYTVEAIELNGNLIAGPRDVLFLKPGEYRVKFRVIADNLQRPIIGTLAGPKPDGYNELTIDVEPGKEYYVGAKLNPDADGYPWSIVLWRVKGD